ncbi:MAG: SHOCT domain-containing protein [Chloroflexia bacterium]|nr:SHOCT domain-containing protein [Chloroflexia bacterium]
MSASFSRDTIARADAEIQEHLAQDRLEDALAPLDRFVGAYRRTPNLLIDKASGMLLAGELEPALAYLDPVLAGGANFDWAYYARALTRRLLGQEQGVQNDLLQAMAIVQERRRRHKLHFDGPMSHLLAKYAPEIRWAHAVDLPLYHLALGEEGDAAQLYQEALRQLPDLLLRLARRRLDLFCTIFPQQGGAQALQERIQQQQQLRSERGPADYNQLLQQLAALHEAGVLSEEEYSAKKAEIHQRIGAQWLRAFE